MSRFRILLLRADSEANDRPSSPVIATEDPLGDPWDPIAAGFRARSTKLHTVSA